MHRVIIYALYGLVLLSYPVQSQTSSYSYHKSDQNWIKIELKENNRFVKYSRNGIEGAIKSYGYYQEIGDSLMLFHEPTTVGPNEFSYEIQEKKYGCNIDDSFRKVDVQFLDLESQYLPFVRVKLKKENIEVLTCTANEEGQLNFSFNPRMIDGMEVFFLGYESMSLPLAVDLPPCSRINIIMAYNYWGDNWGLNYNYFIEKGIYTDSNKSALELGEQKLKREKKN